MKKNNKLNKSFTRTGFTLVETLVAISIFTTSILGLMSVLAYSISNTNYVKQKIIASYLAQEGIEYVRSMRDTYVLYSAANGEDWSSFKGELNSCRLTNNGCGIDNSVSMIDSDFIFQCAPTSKCALFLNNGNYAANSTIGADSGFIRRIRMDRMGLPLDADETKILSTVSWTQGSGSYSVTFSENLFNWVE